MFSDEPLDSSRLASAEALRYLDSRLRTVLDFPKPGIAFKDITPLWADAKAFQLALDLMAQPFVGRGITAVFAPEARGFIFGAPLAVRLGAGFVPVRKPGKLPAPVDEIAYSLEYGENQLAVHQGSVGPDDRVLVVDDLLATGGTAAAAATLAKGQGATVVAYVFGLELTFLAGRDALAAAVGADVHSLLKVEGE